MPSHHPVKVWQSWSCHPTKAHFFNNDIHNFLKSVVTHPDVVAVGEAGLDYSRLPGKEMVLVRRLFGLKLCEIDAFIILCPIP